MYVVFSRAQLIVRVQFKTGVVSFGIGIRPINYKIVLKFLKMHISLISTFTKAADLYNVK